MKKKNGKLPKSKWELVYLLVSGGNKNPYTATVRLKRSNGKQETFEDAYAGQDGEKSVETILKAIDRITKKTGTLHDYALNSAGPGKGANANARLRVSFGRGPIGLFRATHKDVLEATAIAYLDAISNPPRKLTD